tara:strand:- start:5973 stop:6305 length:333 start_codon:yes stop_codon:yes gene_type:complete
VKTVKIDTNKIVDWNSFHKVFSDTMGFPGFYGNNMNAWIDCMTDIDNPGTGMTSVLVGKNETLVIELSNGRDLKERLPEIHEAILECSAFVNLRKLEFNEKALIAVSTNA